MLTYRYKKSLRRNKMENSIESNSPKMTVAEMIGTVLFFLSFLPLIFAVYKGFTGVFFGLQGFAWFFGLPAIIIILIYEGILFFLPVLCLVYQIIFGRSVIRHHDTLVKLTKILVGLIITAALISTVFAGQLLNFKHLIYQSKIRNHLTAQFGEKVAAEISYEPDSMQELSYKAHSPILPQHKSFEIRVINNGEIWDNFSASFFGANENLSKDLRDYIIKKEKLPDEYDFEYSIVSIDYQDYRDGDDYTVLFDRTKYVFTGLTVNYTKVTEAVVMDVMNKVWNEVYSKIPTNNVFAITIKENGTTACRVEITGDPRSNKATGDIYVWSKSSQIYELHKKKIELSK